MTTKTENGSVDHGRHLDTLSSPAEFFAPCPRFGILVLGNPEATKQELFSKIFGVDLEKKVVADAFAIEHDIEKELSLHGQNERLAIFTSQNFGTDDPDNYTRACDFILSHSPNAVQKRKQPVHCIWYCVASEENRTVHTLEKKFFSNDLATLAPQLPVVLTFTKYDEFISQVQLDWSREAQDRGLSKVAVTHILRDLTAKRFEQTIGKRWDDVLVPGLIKKVPRVCVSSTVGDVDGGGFEELAATTLAAVRDSRVRLAFAAAQRTSVFISMQFCATTAADYFTVNTGHARKADGVEMAEIIPNFFAKAVAIFNMRDTAAVLTDPTLLDRILGATFEPAQRRFLEESLHHSSIESGTILLGLSPHERAVLLTQALAGIVLFLHKLADTQWPHEDLVSPYTLPARTVERELQEIRSGTEKQEVLETIEASRIFSSCQLKTEIADLVVKAVEQAERVDVPNSPNQRAGSRGIVVEDDSELQEISLSFVNDKGPDDMFLPCGLKILRLN
ncbi:hypothetical protein B0H63DRAFT_480871 [Podospora didyma]|uniref:G domain-containing protein n=1 Tax=Podospora didyma TaxID=330526 RepID=A0AAE0KDZ5_9PEZI|nr:hypothetical protein B0H63DRAFT_480871 [Podospora didyma]